jgi:hypothetical protein
MIKTQIVYTNATEFIMVLLIPVLIIYLDIVVELN